MTILLYIFLGSALLFLSSFANDENVKAGEKTGDVRWRKHTINDRSPFEGVGVADFNADGLPDVFSGDSWYEAPQWIRHRVRNVPAGEDPHYYEDFADLPMDVNGDGNIDILTCAYFSKKVAWIEHPGDPTKPWIEHIIDTPGSMETGLLADLNSDGKLDYLIDTNGPDVWYELTSQKPEVTWKKHDVGKVGGHGTGTGDVNNDGRIDIITPNGWYEQPVDDSDKWLFHAEFKMGGLPGCLIIGLDFDGDGDTDIIWGDGHDYGLYWLKQSTGANGTREWEKEIIDTTFSMAHVLYPVDLDGDLRPEIVVGKRVYAHEHDPGATDAPYIYSFQFDRVKSQWVREVIYEGEPAKNAPGKAEDRWAQDDFERGTAGVGLQIQACDMDKDGDIDLVCPGKTGLYWFENLGLTDE